MDCGWVGVAASDDKDVELVARLAVWLLIDDVRVLLVSSEPQPCVEFWKFKHPPNFPLSSEDPPCSACLQESQRLKSVLCSKDRTHKASTVFITVESTSALL